MYDIITFSKKTMEIMNINNGRVDSQRLLKILFYLLYISIV